MRAGHAGRHAAAAGGDPGAGRRGAAPNPRRLSVGLEQQPAGDAAGGAAPPRRHRLHSTRTCSSTRSAACASASRRPTSRCLLAIASSLREQAAAARVGRVRRGRPGRRGAAGAARPGAAARSGQARLLVAVMPKANAPKRAIEGLEVIAVERVEQAIDAHQAPLIVVDQRARGSETDCARSFQCRRIVGRGPVSREYEGLAREFDVRAVKDGRRRERRAFSTSIARDRTAPASRTSSELLCHCLARSLKRFGFMRPAPADDGSEHAVDSRVERAAVEYPLRVTRRQGDPTARAAETQGVYAAGYSGRRCRSARLGAGQRIEGRVQYRLCRAVEQIDGTVWRQRR